MRPRGSPLPAAAAPRMHTPPPSPAGAYLGGARACAGRDGWKLPCAQAATVTCGQPLGRLCARAEHAVCVLETWLSPLRCTSAAAQTGASATAALGADMSYHPPPTGHRPSRHKPGWGGGHALEVLRRLVARSMSPAAQQRCASDGVQRPRTLALTAAVTCRCRQRAMAAPSADLASRVDDRGTSWHPQGATSRGTSLLPLVLWTFHPGSCNAWWWALPPSQPACIAATLHAMQRSLGAFSVGFLASPCGPSALDYRAGCSTGIERTGCAGGTGKVLGTHAQLPLPWTSGSQHARAPPLHLDREAAGRSSRTPE